MSLTVLSVGYPFAPVTADPVGGAEQVLARLDRALVERGHRSIVIAPEGSTVAGELLPVPAVAGEIGAAERRRVHAAVRARIGEALGHSLIDLVHMHGADFDACLPPPGPPVLVTLHLPLDWYAEGALCPTRPRTWLLPVSATQAATAPFGAILGPPIANGVPIRKMCARRRGFALALGRICPEKGVDDALDAAAAAGVPMLVAGSAFGYPEHTAFLRERVLPRLDRSRRWIGPVAGHAKDRLIAQARCVVVASKARETSSLVAMESLAAGTPVVACRAGALAEIVEHGRTGFLAGIGDVEGLARGIRAAGTIDPVFCRSTAERRFPVARMIDSYIERYAELTRSAAA